ncbi:uncharacterized protein LOC6529403 isoform X1 [Drosophila yakuba]|uniref:Uncharacterized protein n=1 Tax=Drosophila yakuba TaxID=7245 RepID=B4P873_DROYA|nr:uncharacterized protein LOC6529403 isoform X1 [Drosophila yakuba]EDW90120.2 uncharacterized protein Dyak_GE12823 [Drosophila yakuba]
MTGLAKRRRTAQQILLRRALAKSVSGGQVLGESVLDHGGVVVSSPLRRDSTLVSGFQDISSSRATMKLHRIVASSPLSVLRERKTTGNLPGCDLQSRDSRPIEDNRTLSGHSLKARELSRGSTRSRHSTSNYPSTWHLNISKAKDELKRNSKGSLEEIINCSILNRTAYDHQLNTPIKSDNSCQCTIKKRTRKRVKKNKAVSVAETQTISENETWNYSGERNSPASVGFQILKKRVNSGEDFTPNRMVSKTPSRSSGNSRVSFGCKEHFSGPTHKNYGSYSHSETDIEMGSEYEPKIPCRCDYINKIEKVSKPPTNSGTVWGLKMPSNTEVQEYMTRVTQEYVPVCQNKDMDPDRGIQGRTSNSQFEKRKEKIDQSIRLKAKERILKCQGRNNSEVSYDSFIEPLKEFYGRNKLPTQASLSLEKFGHRNNNVESGERLGKCGTQNVYQDDVKTYGKNAPHLYKTTTNEYPYYDHKEYLANDSDTSRKRHETRANYNQMDKRSCRPEAPGRSKRASRSFDTEDSFRGSFEKGSGRYDDTHSPKCTVGVTQTSALFLPRQQVRGFNPEQPRSERSKTGTRNLESSKAQQPTPTGLSLVTSNSLIIKSHEDQIQSNSVDLKKRERQRNQDCFEPAKPDKSQQPRLAKREAVKPRNQVQCKPQKAEAKSFKLLQSNSLIIQSQEDQHHLVQSSSLEIALPKVTAPKNKKPICTRKRKSSRGCSCCSRCSSRKRSVKKPSPCEKTKSNVCEKCQSKRSIAKNQDGKHKSMSKEQIPKRGLPQGDACDVRELLNILQKTVAGLEKQINSRKGFRMCENSKTTDEGRTQPYTYQRENVHIKREAFRQPINPFQNQYSFKTYSKRASNCGNPSNIYQSNSNTYFTGSCPLKSNAINGGAPQASFTNGSAPYEPFKINIASRQTDYDYPMEICERKSQPYRTQKPFNEPTTLVTGSQGKTSYPRADYKNQSINESFNRSCLNSQCSRNITQVQNYQQNVSTGHPKTDSHYSQISKTTSNAERQAPKEIFKGHQYCPGPEHGQRNRGLTFQDHNNICPETDAVNEGSGDPVQICNNSTCPYALEYFKSWNSQVHPNSNRVDQTEIAQKYNPECPDAQTGRKYGIAHNSEICKQPEHCPYENNRGVVTFQVSDQSCGGEHTLNRIINYEDPTQACDNPSCPEAGRLPSSWENPVCPKDNSAIYYSKENNQPEGNPDCGFNETFPKAGPDYNYEDFCGNPYCSAKNTIIYDTARSEPGEGCQKSKDPSLDYANEPERYLNRNSQKHQTDKAVNQQVCSNHARSQRTRHYFQTAGCSPNCPSNQGEIRHGGPRFTVVNRHRRDKMVQGHGTRNDNDYVLFADEKSTEIQRTNREPDNFENYSQMFPSRRTQLEQYPQHEVEENSCIEDCPYQKYSPNQNIKKNKLDTTCANSSCPDNLKRKAGSNKDIHPPQNRIISRTGNVEKGTKEPNYKNSEYTDKKNIKKDINTYPTNAKVCSSENKCGKEFCKSTREMNRTRNESGYRDSKSRNISSAGRSSQTKKKTKEAGKSAFPEYEFEEHSGLYAENCYNPQNHTAYNFQVCKNPKCPERFGEPFLLKYGEMEYMKEVSGNAHCPNYHGTYRIPKECEATINNSRKVTSERETAYSERKATGQTNFQRKDDDMEIKTKNGRQLNTKSCNHRLKANAIEVCNNQKFPDRLKQTDGNCHCPRKKGIYWTNEKMLVSRVKDQCDVSYDSESCSEDCPYRHRVLFTDLRKCEINSKNRGRQSSGKSDVYYNDQIETRTCNPCKFFVPLKMDRQVLHRHRNLPKAKAKQMHESKANPVVRTVCITPEVPAPVFAQNRHNPLVTDPSLNSYDRHILKNFEIFKEEENKKSRNCAEEYPFLGKIEDKSLILKSSSACICEIESQNHDPLKNCKSDELIEDIDTKRKSSKFSIFSCCLKPPKNDNESRTQQDTEIGNEKALSKPKGFRSKNPHENPKPKEKTPSKSSSTNKKDRTPSEEQSASKSRRLACFQRNEKPQERFNQRARKSPSPTKSGGFLCFKANNKLPPDENLEENSPRYTNEKPAKARNEKNITKESSKKSSRRSGFFTWCRKPQMPKVHDRKIKEVLTGTDCTCSHHPTSHDEDGPIPKYEDPFRCPCAPEEIDDGEVRVLYDSSFRFQKENCSLTKVPNYTYCHNDPQKPEQYAAEIKEQEVNYCPCASANGFYKIVR